MFLIRESANQHWTGLSQLRARRMLSHGCHRAVIQTAHHMWRTLNTLPDAVDEGTFTDHQLKHVVPPSLSYKRPGKWPISTHNQLCSPSSTLVPPNPKMMKAVSHSIL